MLAAISTIFALATLHATGEAEELTPPPCNEDAMIVFDASGSMAGNVDQGIATIRPRIDEARHALSFCGLPHITRYRRVGLITYGPGAYNQCNVQLNLGPTVGAAERIMREVNALIPGGRTPLTSAVDKPPLRSNTAQSRGLSLSSPTARRPAAGPPANSAGGCTPPPRN